MNIHVLNIIFTSLFALQIKNYQALGRYMLVVGAINYTAAAMSNGNTPDFAVLDSPIWGFSASLVIYEGGVLHRPSGFIIFY